MQTQARTHMMYTHTWICNTWSMIGLIMEQPISSLPIRFIISHALVKGCMIRLSNKRRFFCATGFEIGNMMTGRAQRKLLKKNLSDLFSHVRLVVTRYTITENICVNIRIQIKKNKDKNLLSKKSR